MQPGCTKETCCTLVAVKRFPEIASGSVGAEHFVRLDWRPCKQWDDLPVGSYELLLMLRMLVKSFLTEEHEV